MAGTDPERVIFFLVGDLLGGVCPGFEDFTRTCIEGGTRRLRLDLSDLRSLDLAGVNSLLTVHEQLTANGGRLFLTNASPDIVAMLRLFATALLAAQTSTMSGAGASRSTRRAAARSRRMVRQSLAG
ncbi:MAG TPA: STAS domain-containing protein [Jatrophihabitans sp.]|uniref:STAS domain-containing protein n=1 Tax=Jatrophihabitans sp. TaxID=1932789 RepID=UPI002F251BC7